MNIKRVLVLIRQNSDRLFVVMSVLIALVIVIANFFALSNNLIFSDEGWYLCLMRDLPHYGSTRFHLLFNNVFDNNIYAIRVSCWLLQIIGGIVLAIGFCSFVDLDVSQQRRWVLLLLSFSTLYWCGSLQSCPSYNYNNLKIFFAEIGMGLMLLGLSKDNVWYIVFSGFAVAFLFPVMITNTILIPLMFCVILFLSKNKIRNGLGFVAGVVLFAVLYCVAIEPPKEILLMLSSETQHVVDKGENDYGIMFLVKWTETSVMYLCKCAIVASIIFGLNYFMGKHINNGKVKMFLVFVFSFVVLWYSWRYFEPITKLKNGEWFNDFIWIFFFMICLSVLMEKMPMGKREIMMCMLFFLITICLSFGSNVPFYRHREVLPFLNLILLYLVMKKSTWWKALLSGVVVFAFLLFLSGLSGKNWHGDKWFGNHIPVESIGIHQHVKLESGCIDKLVSCREIIPQGRVLNSAENWGQVVLLGYKPLSYDFDVSRNGADWFQQIVDVEMEREGQLWAISHVWQTGFNDYMMLLQGYEMEIDTIHEDVYFHVWTNKDDDNTLTE